MHQTGCGPDDSHHELFPEFPEEQSTTHLVLHDGTSTASRQKISQKMIADRLK